MASQVAVLHPPTKQQMAHAISDALPSELSQSPLLGILGVVLGAGIVTLTGRMLRLGTADLKGSLGIGFDDGAWIGSAYNVALMFIGPFTVLIAWACVLALLLVALLRKSPLHYGELGFLEAGTPATERTKS